MILLYRLHLDHLVHCSVHMTGMSSHLDCGLGHKTGLTCEYCCFDRVATNVENLGFL